MKAKLFLSLLTIVIAVALVGGATMAWFTDESGPIENVFTAGSIEIESGGKEKFENWNPGDSDIYQFCVENTGSKDARVRLNMSEGRWSPGPLRILVLYTDTNIQLIGVEWETFCQGCTGEEGPMATGTADYSYDSGGSPRVLNTDYYFRVEFSNLDQEEDWLDDDAVYHGWCLDNQVTIDPGPSRDVEIFDPFCNPDWVDDTDASGALKTRWENIDFDEISYIINHEFLSRGYNSTEVQQAIWHYTNNEYNDDYYQGDAEEIHEYIDDIGDDLVTALNDIDNVGWSISGDDWEEIAVEGETHFYYKGLLEPGDEVCLDVEISLSGPDTTNEYQGMEYIAAGYFEAIQASNYAPYYEWGVDIYGEPDEPENDNETN